MRSQRATRIIALDDVTALAELHRAQHQGACRRLRQGIAARNSRFPAKADPFAGRGDRPRHYPDVADRPARSLSARELPIANAPFVVSCDHDFHPSKGAKCRRKPDSSCTTSVV